MYLIIHIFMLVLITSLEAAKLNKLFFETANDETVSISLMQELIQRVETLEARDETHQQEMEDMNRELINQRKEITILRKNNAEQSRLISKLFRKMHMSTSAREDEPEDTTKKTIVDMKSMSRIRRAENEATVIFSTGLTRSMTHLGKGQNVVFDHVETNVGNGYNPHHGFFTAPVAGTYVFHSSILAFNNREVWCDMVVNGIHKAAVYARGTDGRHDQGSQVIIVHLKQGDDVAVQNKASDDAIYGDGDIYTTFSGFLLLQDFSIPNTIVG